MRQLFFLLVTFCLGCNSQTVTSKVGETAKKEIAQFFSTLKSGKANKALTDLFNGNPYFNQADSSVIDLKNKFVLINANSGAYMGNSLIKTKKLNDVIALYSYLLKYEATFYRVNFIYYDNGKDIRIHKFDYNPNIEIELETSVQMEMLNQ